MKDWAQGTGLPGTTAVMSRESAVGVMDGSEEDYVVRSKQLARASSQPMNGYLNEVLLFDLACLIALHNPRHL